MTEKEMFLRTWEREFQTTLKVLKAFPSNQLDLKPHERSRTARDLAWNFAAEEKLFVEGCISGSFDFANYPKAPATMQDIISAYEKTHQEMVDKVKKLSDEDFNKLIKFLVAPKQMGDVRRGDLLWGSVMDKVHHRGQFSIYVRMAGGKVPSIYGPSADEPWM